MKDRTAPPSSIQGAREALTTSVASARRTIVRHVVRGAVEAYQTALRAKDEAREMFEDQEELDAMTEVVNHRVLDAEKTLVRAILSIDPSGDAEWVGFTPEMRLGRPRGVSHGGLFYIVIPDPTVSEDMELGDEAQPEGDREAPQVMRLSVLDRSAVEDMDDSPIHSLDEPAPPRVQADDDR